MRKASVSGGPCGVHPLWRYPSHLSRGTEAKELSGGIQALETVLRPRFLPRDPGGMGSKQDALWGRGWSPLLSIARSGPGEALAIQMCFPVSGGTHVSYACLFRETLTPHLILKFPCAGIFLPSPHTDPVKSSIVLVLFRVSLNLLLLFILLSCK